MKEKFAPHIITAAALVVFIVLGLASATKPSSPQTGGIITINNTDMDSSYFYAVDMGKPGWISTKTVQKGKSVTYKAAKEGTYTIRYFLELPRNDYYLMGDTTDIWRSTSVDVSNGESVTVHIPFSGEPDQSGNNANSFEQAIDAAAETLIFYLPRNTAILIDDVTANGRPLADAVIDTLSTALEDSGFYQGIVDRDRFYSMKSNLEMQGIRTSTADLFRERGITVLINGEVSETGGETGILRLEASDVSGQIIATVSEPFNLKAFWLAQAQGLYYNYYRGR